MHVILLHSTGGDPQESFFPWIRDQLEQHGFRVSTPSFPSSDEPDPEVAVPKVMGCYDPDETTILVGRSSGGTLIPHVLEQEAVHAAAAISIAAPFDDLGWPNLLRLFARKPDFSAAQKAIDHYEHWYSDDDPHVPLEHASRFQDVLGGDIRVFEGYSHFYGPEFPELLEKCVALSKYA